MYKSKIAMFQVALLILGVSMVGIGVMRGEAGLVLGKAIRLCLECIGLDNKNIVKNTDNNLNKKSKLLARFRGWIQAAATLVSNINLPNFVKGGIYQGSGKAVCVPGLNCYSCPAASSACPIGSFQAVVGSSKFSFSYYITGFLILMGVLLGRFICGFLCPFGWLQDLLHKIPGPKFSTEKLGLSFM